MGMYCNAGHCVTQKRAVSETCDEDQIVTQSTMVMLPIMPAQIMLKFVVPRIRYLIMFHRTIAQISHLALPAIMMSNIWSHMSVWALTVLNPDLEMENCVQGMLTVKQENVARQQMKPTPRIPIDVVHQEKRLRVVALTNPLVLSVFTMNHVFHIIVSQTAVQKCRLL